MADVGDIDLVEELVEAGADVDAHNDDGDDADDDCTGKEIIKAAFEFTDTVTKLPVDGAFDTERNPGK